MKIKEIIENRNCNYMRSRVSEIFERYKDKEVVVSLIENSFGVAFLIKGKVKPFAFAMLNKPLVSDYSYTIQEIEVKEYFKLLNEVKEEESIKVVDEEQFKQVKAKSMLQALNQEDNN